MQPYLAAPVPVWMRPRSGLSRSAPWSHRRRACACALVTEARTRAHPQAVSVGYAALGVCPRESGKAQRRLDSIANEGPPRRVWLFGRLQQRWLRRQSGFHKVDLENRRHRSWPTTEPHRPPHIVAQRETATGWARTLPIVSPRAPSDTIAPQWKMSPRSREAWKSWKSL